MRKEFKVWAPDSGDAEDADIVLDVLPEFAAEHWVEANHADLDYPDEVDVHVRSPDGTLTIWTVSCENVLICRASLKDEGKEDES